MENAKEFISRDAIDELKHSIRIHLLLMQGPTQQLCAMLLKLLDIMEDSDSERRNREANELAFNIIEGVALYVQRFIDDKAEKAKAAGATYSYKSSGDKILVMIGMSRQVTDKRTAKLQVLKSIADALKDLSNTTDSKYPDIYDCNGVKL